MKKAFTKAAFAVLAAGMLTGCSAGERIEESSAELLETTLEESLEIEETAEQEKIEETKETEAEILKEDEIVQIKAEENQTEGMECFHRFDFSYGEDSWALCFYGPEEAVEEDGTLMLDDSCPFLIQIERENGRYVLLDETIQLGVPQADVWTDEEERLHITLRDVRSACYKITDFIYMEEGDLFEGRQLVNQQGINYMGTAGGF